MAKYRETLPQSSNELFLTDGGIETTLIFDEGLDLPYFVASCHAAFRPVYRPIQIA